MATAVKAMQETASGIVKARRIAIAQGPTPTDIDPGPRIQKFICKNVGALPIRINFDSDTNANYWELAPGEVLPVTINIIASTVIHCRGIGGASDLECILWG